MQSGHRDVSSVGILRAPDDRKGRPLEMLITELLRAGRDAIGGVRSESGQMAESRIQKTAC